MPVEAKDLGAASEDQLSQLNQRNLTIRFESSNP